jgi:hypothetical protein
MRFSLDRVLPTSPSRKWAAFIDPGSSASARVVIGAKRRGARAHPDAPANVTEDRCLDQLPPRHERHPGQRNSALSSIQTRRLQLDNWYLGAWHRLRQKRDIRCNHIDRTLFFEERYLKRDIAKVATITLVSAVP